MATIAYALSNPPTIGRSSSGVLVVSWVGLANSDYGQALSVPALADRSIHLLGALGTGGAATIYGTNKPDPNLATDTDWSILNDPQANPLVMSVLKVESVMEPTLWIRPKITAGDGSTLLNLYLVLIGK